jgi:hypothetical protein
MQDLETARKLCKALEAEGLSTEMKLVEQEGGVEIIVMVW